eukprot:2690449-Rhodomonas_salina.2
MSQCGSNEGDELHVLLTMEGSVRLILAVDAVLELLLLIRAAPLRGFALTHKGMEGRLVPNDSHTPLRW